jgi:hypothetical protein
MSRARSPRPRVRVNPQGPPPPRHPRPLISGELTNLLQMRLHRPRVGRAASLGAGAASGRGFARACGPSPPPAPPPAAPSAVEAASGTPDDACKRAEERLAELQAKPSIKDVSSFADEFRCSKLQPQLLALLDSLGQAVQSEGASGPNGAPPSTKSAGETAPPPSASATQAASGTPDDVCNRDGERLAELQAKPSIKEVLSFADEFRCSKLQPQLLAVLDNLGLAVQSEGASGPNGALPGTKFAGETAPPPSAPSAAEGASAAQDDACKRDEDRLDRLRQNPSREDAAHFAEELSCERLRPQLLALASDLAKPPSGSKGVSKDAATETTTANETPSAAPPRRPSRLPPPLRL